MKEAVHLPSHNFQTLVLGILAGVGVAAMGLFGKGVLESLAGIASDMRREGFVTVASARMTPGEIAIDARSVPLPPRFWSEREGMIEPPEEEDRVAVAGFPEVETASWQPLSPSASAVPPPPLPEPTPSAPPAPPAPPAHGEVLKSALAENMASVFTGDLPYVLLKSGDRLYAGSVLLDGVTLEAISPQGVICNTPDGLVKIDLGSPSTSSSTPALASPTPLPQGIGSPLSL